jgi:hypothetical protein
VQGDGERSDPSIEPVSVTNGDRRNPG